MPSWQLAFRDLSLLVEMTEDGWYPIFISEFFEDAGEIQDYFVVAIW